MVFFFSSRRRHTISLRDWSSDVCSSDLTAGPLHRLQLTDEDAVDALADGFAAGQIGHRREALRHAQLRDVAGALAHEALLTRELVVGDGPFHAASLYGVGCSR